jgi:glycosyltransferase involved in cell wall biosynthesis
MFLVNSRNPRHVAINALHMAWGVNAGTETYLSNIVYPWYVKAPPDIIFTIICQAIPPWWQGERNHFKIRVFTSARRLFGRALLEQIVLPLEVYPDFDLIFHPGYVGSLYTSVAQLITIHDAFAWIRPKEVGLAKSMYWKMLIPASARNARQIIVDTAATATDISKHCSIPLRKISVVHLAGGHLSSIEPDVKLLTKLSIAAGDYFHSVGVFKDLKNPWRILDAYRQYRERCGDSGNPKQLVMAGYIGGKNAVAIEKAARGQPGVVVAGRVSDNELAALYIHSAGLIFPSLYEGFGLPILEAQRLECPVVTSNLSCMPEVAGKGAIFVDPTNIGEITAAFLLLGAGKPARIVELGKENAGSFSWAKASITTLGLVNEVLSHTERSA